MPATAEPPTQPQAETPPPVPNLPGSKPSNPTDALVKVQEAVQKGIPDGFAEIDQLVKQNMEPKPRRSILKREAPKAAPKKEDQPKTKQVATAKPQSQEPDKPAEEAEPADVRKMATASPEDLVDDFMSPQEFKAAEEAAKAEKETDEDKPEVQTEGEEVAEVEPLKGSKIKPLRDAYEGAKKRLKELEEELKIVKETPRDDPEKQQIAQALEELKTRNRELQDELKFANYQRSDEFKDRYIAPMQRAYETAYNLVGEIKIAERTDDVGEVIQPARQANAADFDAIMGLSTVDAAREARRLFGDAAEEVLHHRRKLLELRSEAQNAVEEFKTKGGEREKQTREQSEKERAELKKIWDTTSREIAEKYPAYFKPVEGNDEANALLEKGYQVADYALSNPNIPKDKLVKLHSMMRHKAAAFDAVVHRFRSDLSAAQERIKELETELKQYGDSEPGASEKHGREVGSQEDSWEDEIDSLARKNR